MKGNLRFSEEDIYNFNIITKFLASRDIKELSPKELQDRYGIEKTDLIILLGNSIPYTAEIAVDAFKKGIAKELMVVGGVGHSTDYLRDNINKYYEDYNIKVDGRAEADILKDYIIKHSKINEKNILIENMSTNCGSNAVEALKTIKEINKTLKYIILIQDPTMQLRTFASFQKEWEKNIVFINYSPFIPEIKSDHEGFSYVHDDIIKGLWDYGRFVSLVMGEIPRLMDNEAGYGPKGKNFIAHVDIPEEVIKAYNSLLPVYGEFLKLRNK